MLQKVVEAHLSGQSSRKIASWLVPTVAHTTISRYIVQHIAPVMGNAEALKLLLRSNRDENTPLPPALQGVATEQQIDRLAIQAITSVPALHIREKRIQAKTDRWRRVQMIVDGRAADMSLCANCKKPKDIHPWEDDVMPERRCDTFIAVPGGESGFLARDFKGAGENLQEVYRFDDALFKSFGDIEKDIAIELGQWQENTGTGSVSIQIVCPTVAGEQPRISFARDESLLIEGDALTDAEDGGISEIGLLQK